MTEHQTSHETQRQAQTPNKSPMGPILAVGALAVLGVALILALLKGPANPTAPDSPGVNDAQTRADERLSPDLFFQTEKIAFKPMTIDTEALTAARQRIPGHADPKPKGVEEVMEAFKILNTTAAPEAQDRAAREFNLRLTEFIGVQHQAGFEALLVHTYPDFRAALDKLLGHLRQHKGDLEALLRSPTGPLKDAVAWAGGFARLAKRLGLINADHTIDERLDPLVEVLYRYRIAQALRGTYNPEEMMSLLDLRVLNQWRLQEATGIPPERRVKYADTLARLWPDYPAMIARGVVRYQADELAEARSAFLTAASFDPRFKPIADQYLTHFKDAKAP